MEGCIEVNCSVLGGPDENARASVCEQPVPWEEFLTFEDKYLRAGKGDAKLGMAGADRRIPAPISDDLTEKVRADAVTAFTAVDAAGVARVDSFVDESSGETWVMEINTTPGSFSFYLWEASGLSFAELIDELIVIAQRCHKMKTELLFTFDSGMLDAQRGGKSGGR
jgi:D-alanine-D-alanine ligase